METRDATDISFKSLQSVLQRLTLRDINGCLNWIIEKTIEKVKNQNEMTRSTQVTTNTEENEHLLLLLYKGKVGEKTSCLPKTFFNHFHNVYM